MILTLGNVVTQVTATPAEAQWLDQYLSWEEMGAKHSPAFKSGVWDGRHHLLTHVGFPTGLAPAVIKAAGGAGFIVEVYDRRFLASHSMAPRAIPADWLRGYQEQAVARCRDLTAPLSGRGIVHIPTGGGKTRCIAAIAWAETCHWVMLVDTKDLLDQGATAYESLTGDPAGRCGDGVWRVERFTVATIQTLLDGIKTERVKRLLGAAGGVFIDEVHGAASDSHRKVLSHTNAYWRLGFSATPLGREDKRDLLMVGAVGPIIFKVRPQQLEDLGVTARPDIAFVTYPSHPKPYWDPVEAAKAEGGPRAAWPVAYDLGVVRSELRNQAVLDVTQHVDKPAMVFVKAVAHGETLTTQLNRAGLRAEFVWGQDARVARKAAITSLERGDLDVLVCSKVFNKGIDIPSLRGLVNAAGGSSMHDAIQRLGRGTRATSDKHRVQFFDFVDRGPWITRHAKKRAKAYEDAGYKVRAVDVTKLKPGTP